MFYIHIGVPKTGTSSIQKTMFKNRDRLLDNGINYLSVRANSGRVFASMLRDDPQPSTSRRHFAARKTERLRRQVLKELSSNRSRKFVISTEMLSVLSPDAVRQLKKMLDPFADAYRIIVYVRNPYDYANSATVQAIHGDRGLSLEDAVKDLPRPNYRKKISKYIHIFGRANVDIRIFDQSRLVGGDLISDFLAALGERPELKQGMAIVHANASISHEAAMILSEINKIIPTLIDNAPNPARAAGFSTLMAEILGQKFSIDPSAYLENEAEVWADLEWLYDQIGDPVFGRPSSRPASVPQWNEATIRSIRTLVTNLATQIRALEGSLQSSAAGVMAPKGLEWLLDPKPGAAAGAKAQAATLQPFDQATIRSLGCFIHSMARAIQLSQPEKRNRLRFEGTPAVLIRPSKSARSPNPDRLTTTPE
jgi:hypothetical protein